MRSEVLGRDIENFSSGTATLPALRRALPSDRHPVAVYLARLSPGSRRTMKQVLGVIAYELGGTVETLPWHLLRYQHTQAIRTRLAERYAPATCNKALAALRAVLKEAFRLGQMSADDHARAADLEAVRGSRVLSGRALSQGEIRSLFGACDPRTNQGARDAALLALGYGGGLRRAELVALDLTDYDQAESSVTVLGKGRKQRIVYATNGSADALANWIKKRGAEPGPLFHPIDKADQIKHGRRLTPDAVLVIVRRIATTAGVTQFSPHDLRRTFVGDLLDQGADLATVQGLAGHASPTTTARYDRRGERAKRKAAELLHVPFASGRQS